MLNLEEKNKWLFKYKLKFNVLFESLKYYLFIIHQLNSYLVNMKY